MPIYTIETPRGRKVTIEAADEATAMRGAEQWEYQDFAASEARAAGLDPDLVLRQMKAESAGNQKAVSPKGARGLMQLMPATAKELGVNPDDPYDNIRGGVRYLKQQFDAFGGDEKLALAAYNAGPGAVRKYGGVPPYAETQNYVRMLSGQAPTVTAEVVGKPELGVGAAFKPPPRQVAPQLGPPANAPLRKDQGLGFAKGAFAPLDNLAGWVEGGLERAGVDTGAVAGFLGTPTASEAEQSRTDFLAGQKAKGVIPGKIGEFGGNVVGTLPTAFLPGGLLAQGAASGALLSEADTLGGIAADAGIGMVGAKIGDMAMKGVGKAIAAPFKGKVPSADGLKTATQAAYQAADDAGVKFAPGTFDGFLAATADDVRAARYNPLLHGKVTGVLDEFGKMRGQSPTLGEVDQIRQFVRNNIMAGGSADEQRLGKIVLDNIDELISTAGTKQVVAGDPKAGAAAIRTARDFNTRSKKAEAVTKALDDATLRTQGGGNIDNVIRQELRKVLKTQKNLTPAERNAIEQAVKGGSTQNALRLLGRFSPTAGALPAFLSTGLTMANPLFGMLGIAGLAGKAAGDRMTKGAVDDILRIIAAGGKPTPSLGLAQTGRALSRGAAPVAAGVGAVAATGAAADVRRPALQGPPANAPRKKRTERSGQR